MYIYSDGCLTVGMRNFRAISEFNVRCTYYRYFINSSKKLFPLKHNGICGMQIPIVYTQSTSQASAKTIFFIFPLHVKCHKGSRHAEAVHN